MGDSRLRLTILDTDSEELTPARVEVIDASKTSYIAEDALPTGGD